MTIIEKINNIKEALVLELQEDAINIDYDYINFMIENLNYWYKKGNSIE